MKLARFAIFLTGVVGLAIGGIMSISSLRSQQEETVLRNNEVLKSQAQSYVDQFFGTLEAVKVTNTAITPAAINEGTTLPYVTHRGVIKLNQGVASEVEAFAGVADLALEERVLKALKTQLSFNDLQLAKVSVGTFELTELVAKEGLYVATPVYKVTNGVVDPTTIEKVNISLVDPAKAFAGFAKSTARHVYLLNKNGHVLAHSASAYIGTDLKKIESLRDTLENLFLGAQTGAVGQYTAVDGTKEQVAFIRAGTYPFAIGVEQKTTPAVLSAGWISDQLHSGAARENLGLLSVMVGIALALFSAVSIWLSRELRRQVGANANARFEREQDNVSDTLTFNLTPPAPTSNNTSINTATVRMPSAIDEAAMAFRESRAQIAQELNEANASAEKVITIQRDWVKEFTDKVENGYTIEATEKELVQISSELTESPVLYLRYQRRTQNLGLASVAGKVQIPNYGVLQAYVRKDIEAQIENLANQGKVASVTNYGPIAKLMISNLNVAHFEAWAVTSDQEISGTSRLVGVLIVLQAGFQSTQVRPVLAKLIREGGNYLYAQSNKIRSRSGIAAAMNADEDVAEI